MADLPNQELVNTLTIAAASILSGYVQDKGFTDTDTAIEKAVRAAIKIRETVTKAL